MAALAFVALLLAMAGRSSGSWCVCKQAGDAVLQKTLDYACGAGADCNPIHQNGPCFNPNTVFAHCNYAVNSYFQRKGQAPGSCDFSGTAAVSPTDPSTAGCAYPASASATGSTPGTSTTPTTVNPTTPGGGGSSTSPFVTNPSTGSGTGVLGGNSGGLGPSGAGINTDESDGGINMLHMRNFLLQFLMVLMFSAGFVHLLWGY